VIRRTRLIAGPLLIVFGLALSPLMNARWSAHDMMPADVHADIFAGQTQAQFSATHSGYYGLWFVVSRDKPFKEVYCLLRSPYDYWSSVSCEDPVRFSADWKLTENGVVVLSRRNGRSAAGIANFTEAGNRYLKRFLGNAYLEKGRYYTLAVDLSGSDVALREVNPRLQVRLDQNEIDMHGWLSLWAWICVPLSVFGGVVMIIRGLRAKPPKSVWGHD
jgi:hypothetical protein